MQEDGLNKVCLDISFTTRPIACDTGRLDIAITFSLCPRSRLGQLANTVFADQEQAPLNLVRAGSNRHCRYLSASLSDHAT